MTKKKEKRGRKALPAEEKKPPQPTIKINSVLLPFVKLLKHEYKAKRVDAAKLEVLTRLLLNSDLDPKTEGEDTPQSVDADKTQNPVDGMINDGSCG